jgi:alpha-galactosidase
MDELKRRHAGLEIESCSSGGSRVDYGVLEHTDRVWASDCIDPLERVRIISGLSTLLPLELLGAHVASGRSHTTGRVHDLGFRLAVALFGHSGFEWDLTTTSSEQRQSLARWVDFAKRVRPLLHSGEMTRVDRPGDPGTALLGVVAPDGAEALFLFARLATDARYGSSPMIFPGLRANARYRVVRVPLADDGATVHGPWQRPGVDEIEAPGALLSVAGIEAPSLPPEHAAVYHLQALT